MNKRTSLLALGALAATGAVAARSRGTDAGARLYDASMAAESRGARLRTRVVDVDGLPVSLYEGGPADAPTVLLVHGFSADRRVWVRFAKHLTKDFHVVVPDLAGHGTTPYVAGPSFGGPAQAALLIGLLDALGVERAHVLGNSMGGFIAATLAVTAPARVLSLGLCDAAGVTATRRNALEEGILAGGRNPFLMDDPAQFPEFYAMTMAKPPFVPGVVKRSMARDYVRRREQLTDVFEQFYGQHFLDERLHEITAPTLVLWGSEDQLVDPTAADVWAAGITGARTLVYDGVGHMPMLEVPRRCARDYRAFVESVTGGPVARTVD